MSPEQGRLLTKPITTCCWSFYSQREVVNAEKQWNAMAENEGPSTLNAIMSTVNIFQKRKRKETGKENVQIHYITQVKNKNENITKSQRRDFQERLQSRNYICVSYKYWLTRIKLNSAISYLQETYSIKPSIVRWVTRERQELWEADSHIKTTPVITVCARSLLDLSKVYTPKPWEWQLSFHTFLMRMFKPLQEQAKLSAS